MHLPQPNYDLRQSHSAWSGAPRPVFPRPQSACRQSRRKTEVGGGHARLILERFGRFWGAFSVVDLFLLNALTIVTEFIGISLGLSYLGLPKVLGMLISAVVVAAAATGRFRRFLRAVCGRTEQTRAAYGGRVGSVVASGTPLGAVVRSGFLGLDEISPGLGSVPGAGRSAEENTMHPSVIVSVTNPTIRWIPSRCAMWRRCKELKGGVHHT